MCAIVNDDYTGLDDKEEAIVTEFLKDLGDRYLFIAPSDQDEYFTRCHDFREYGILACDCMAVDVAFRPESAPDYDADDEICNRYNSITCGMLIA